MNKFKNYKRYALSNLGATFKILTAAVFVGVAGIFTQACTEETSAINLSDKSSDAPALDYLKDNNVSISQNIAENAPLLGSFDNTSSITANTLAYNIDSLNLGTSQNITWEEVSAPIESTDPRTGTIEVNLPDGGIKYYKYSYTMPSDYSEAAESINNDNFTSENITNKLFQGYDNSAITVNGDYSGLNIIADFIDNNGAIYNDNGKIGDITGDFIGNTSNDGAIYNNGTIGNITGNFIKNSSAGNGGAIYNQSTIGDIINSSFIGNSAGVNGGAISTNSNLNIKADNGTSGFEGNYIQSGAYDAIYMENSNTTLTLGAYNNGNILFHDNIDGNNGYSLTLNGDATGQIDLTGVVKNASTATLDTTHLTFAENTFNSNNLTFKADSGFVELKDNEFKTYTIDKISSNETAKWNLDIDLLNQKSDVIKTNQASSGKIYIDSVSTDNIPVVDGEHKVQVLYTQDSALQLALNSALTNKTVLKEEHVDGDAVITNDVAWNHTFNNGHFDYKTYGQLGLTNSSTLNDTIIYTISTELTGENYTKAGDTLTLWNTHIPENNAEKNFNFASATDVYTTTDNVGVSQGSVLNINGIANGSDKSAIDFVSNYTGFELTSGKTLNVNNIDFVNPKIATGSILDIADGATVNLNGINQATVSADNALIKNDGTINFNDSLSSINTYISGSGTINVNTHVKLFEEAAESVISKIEQNLITVHKDGTLEVFGQGKLYSDLTIDNGGSAILSSSGVTRDVLNNGSLSISTGTLEHGINGTGTTTVMSGATVTNNGIISQALSIASGAIFNNNADIGSTTGVITNAGTINSSASNIKGNVTNNRTLNLTGGTLDKTVSGTGTTNITATVTGNAAINQAISIATTGKLTSLAGYIGGKVNNAGDLTLTGGTLSKAVSGSGITNIAGDVASNASIGQNITIADTATLTSNASNIGGSVTNAGSLALNGGTLSKAVSASGMTSIIGNVINNASIGQNISITDAAALTSNASNIGGIVTNAGNLTLNGGTLSQRVSGNGTTNITGNVLSNVLVGQNIKIAASGNLTSNAANIGGNVNNAGILTISGGTLNNAVSGNGNTNISGTVTNNAAVQQNVTIAATGDLTNNNTIGNVINNGILTSDASNLTGSIRNNSTLNLTGTIGKAISGMGTTYAASGLTLTDGTNIEGTLDVSSGQLLSVSGGENAVYSIGKLTGDGDVNVSGGNFTIKNDASLHDLTNNGNTTISGNLIATGNIVNEKTLNISGNATAQNLTNKGGMEVSGSLVVNEIIRNTGDLDILGSAQAKEIINTGNMTVKENASVEIASDLTTTEDITTSGNLWVIGSINAKDLSNDGDLTVGKNVTVETLTNIKTAKVSGDVTINGVTVDGKTSFQNDGTATIDGKLKAAGDIVNNNELTVNGKVTAVNVNNTKTLSFNNGTEIQELNNSGTANIANGLKSSDIINSNILNLKAGDINVNTINNTSVINITNGANAVINTAINGDNGNITITDSTFTTNGLIQNQNITANNSRINLGSNSEILKSSVLNVNKSHIYTTDGQYTNYVIDELNSSADSRYHIDIDLSRDSQKSDTFTLTNGGSGTIYLSSINVINNCIDNDKFRLQVIKSGTENAPQLDYDRSKVLDQVSANTTNDMIIAKEFGLYTTDTLNDTLEIRGWRDIFGEWSEFETEEDKTFTFVNDNKYTLTRDVLEYTGNTATIIGKGNIFDSNNYNWYEKINEDQTISISDLKIINNKGEMDNKGYLILNNVYSDKDIVNNNILELNNNITLKKVTNNAQLTHTGNKIVITDLTNNDITEIDANNTTINNLTNNKNVNIESRFITSNITNNSDGEVSLAGNLHSDEIKNSGNIDIKGTASVSNLTNDNKFNIKGDFNAENIVNNAELNVEGSVFNAGRISATTSGNINIDNTTLNVLGLLEKQNISAALSTINAANPYWLADDSLSLNNSTMNLGALGLKPLHINNLEMTNSTINIPSTQVDFISNTMGSLSTGTAIADNNSIINLNYLNNINVPSKETKLVELPFIDSSISHNVSYNGQGTIYAPIYRYGVTYDPETGNMYFARGGKYNPTTGNIDMASNPAKQFNPAVLASGAAAHTAANSIMNQTYNYVFQNAENFMAYPLKARQEVINRNKYAINNPSAVLETDTLCPLFGMNSESSSWYKPFANFETIDFKNGPVAHTTTYGSLVGFDTSIKNVKGDWARTYTGYIGYNGASQSFGGVHTTMNGGLLGGTVTMYKGNFFNATTLSAGASLAETNSMYGHEDITMLIAGAANKTGYNFEFKEGRFIVQPNLLLSYTYVNTFDYTNAAGVNIDSNPLHSIQLSPGFKIMANTKNGWQPYIAVNTVVNFMDKTKVTADSVRLPGMSTRPYVQYGIGLQKNIKDRLMAFGQTMFQSGGRHGVAITAGLRWSFGKEHKKYEKVQNDNRRIVVIKK